MTEKRTAPSSREQLWGVLLEAAEIEHNLMCCYLYAMFSLKESVEEEVSEAELAAIKRWRGEILDVAIEEMAHLTIVSNILSGVGGPAHFARQNFPVPAGYHPAGVVVKLAPFNVETLDHFIFLERPESVAVEDGAGFEPSGMYARAMKADRLMSAAMDYATVGQLYASIEEALRLLSEELGEEQLFLGDATRQIGPDVVALPNLLVVRSLKAACEGIDAIVRQGEGSDPAEAGSHFQRFLAIREEYRALIAIRPDFKPARPAAHNPVMRKPPSPDGKVWVSAEPAATLLDLANALYNHSLRCLSLAYGGVDKEAQRGLVNTAIGLMRLLTPVASSLTSLTANVESPGCTAGISFATLRSAAAIPAGPSGLFVVVERLKDIGRRALALPAEHPAIAHVAEEAAVGVFRLAEQLGKLERVPEQSAVPVHFTEPSAGVPPVPQQQSDGSEVIAGSSIDLIFSTKRCIHARHCVLGQPRVFKANVEGPWIDPDATSTEALVAVAHMCPSGAIQYVRRDGGEQEQSPPVNLVQLRENGPLGIRAEMLLDGQNVGLRATLCRCGASANKPFCDGSHQTIGFQATGEPATRPSEPLAVRDGSLRIDLEPNGPLVLTGNAEMCSGTGRTFDRVTATRLCRCGGSGNKPYCDGTHRKIGFVT